LTIRFAVCKRLDLVMSIPAGLEKASGGIPHWAAAALLKGSRNGNVGVRRGAAVTCMARLARKGDEHN